MNVLYYKLFQYLYFENLIYLKLLSLLNVNLDIIVILLI